MLTERKYTQTVQNNLTFELKKKFCWSAIRRLSQLGRISYPIWKGVDRRRAAQPSDRPYYKEKTVALAENMVETFNLDDRAQDSYLVVLDLEIIVMNMILAEIKAEKRISL